MPILDRKVFRRFGIDDPFGDFKSRLPSPAIMDGYAISPLYSEILSTYPAGQTLNGARHTQAIAGRVSTTVGIADYTLGATEAKPLGRFEDLLSKHIGNALPLPWTNSGKQIVNELGMEILDQAAAELCTKVPIVGWVAQAGIFVAKMVKQLRRDIDDAPPKSYQKAILYDRAADDDATAYIMSMVESGQELTAAFLPSLRVADFEAGNTRTPFGCEGIRLEPTGQDRTGAGLVPGIAEIGDVVQYPDKNVNGVGRGVPQTFGNLHPSAAQLSLILWQAVTKNGPLAFEIDGPQIADAWEDYYTRLIEWAQRREPGEWADHHWIMVSQVASWARYGSKVDTVRGLGRYFPERQTHAHFGPTAKCPAKKICVPERYCQWRGRPNMPLVASRGGLVRYMVEQQWQAKLRYYLGTLTCAYVPRSAPAFRHVPGLADYHEEMRSLLLTHKARYKVDLDMVPDDGSGFREDLARSVMAAGTDKLASPSERDVPEPKLPKFVAVQLDDVPPVDPGLETAPADLAPPDPAVPGPEVGPGALVGLLIAGGVGALLLGTLKGVKR